jgi:hypothetical protein
MHLPGTCPPCRLHGAGLEHVGWTLNCGDAKVARVGRRAGEGLRDGCLLSLFNQLGIAETRD